MKKTLVTFRTIFSLIAFVVPVIVYAAGIIPCDGPNCGFNDLLVLANNIVHFLIYDVIVPLVALRFMYIGANYILKQDKEGAHTEAKGQLESIGLGIFWVIASFLLVKVILYNFLNTDQEFTLFLLQ